MPSLRRIAFEAQSLRPWGTAKPITSGARHLCRSTRRVHATSLAMMLLPPLLFDIAERHLEANLLAL
jgi:hypothetical protein